MIIVLFVKDVLFIVYVNIVNNDNIIRYVLLNCCLCYLVNIFFRICLI